MMTRRSLIAAAAATAFAKGKKVPVGLELYSVREALKQDLMGTVRAVAKLGYEGVEFYAPYLEWTTDYARDVRKLLDDVGMKCYSTHNSGNTFSDEKMPKAIELNRILGSKYIVMASAGKVADLDGWKEVAARLTKGAEQMKSAGLKAGFHNHDLEFRPISGTRPMDVLAKNTPKDVTLQLDVGTCIKAGSDPVEWINQNPGRIRSMHCKDWAPDPNKGFRVLFGEGVAQWKKIFDAAEKTGGIEYYLIEQEGSGLSELETVAECLKGFRKTRA